MDCGGCAFMLFYNDECDCGLCEKTIDKDFSIKATDKSCKNWIDARVRYTSQIKEITDKKTLQWLHKVINQAYMDRLFLD